MGAQGQELGLLEAPVAQRERRAVVLCHVEHEGLRGLLGGLAQRGDLPSGGLQIAEGDERRCAPGHRLGPDLGVAELLAEVSRLGHHVEDLLERARPERPVRAHQDCGEPDAIPKLPRHGDRRSCGRSPRARSRPGSRARARARPAARPAAPSCRRRAPLPRSRAARRRPDLPSPGASMRPRSRSRPGRAAARLPAPGRCRPPP